MVAPQRLHGLDPTFSYRLVTTDGGLAAVAARYHTNVATIRRQSLRWDRTWTRFSLEPTHAFTAAVHAGQPSALPPYADTEWVTLLTPEAEKAHDWLIVPVTAASNTLLKLCDEHNRNAERVAAHMAALTPLDLWRASPNRMVRNAVLHAHASDDLHAIDHDPGHATIPDGLVVAIPYPRQAAGAPIHAVPNPAGGAGGVQPNTVTVHPPPDWLLELFRDHLGPIVGLTATLAGKNAVAKATLERGGAWMVKLSLLRQVFRRYLEDQGSGNILEPNVAKVDEAFGDLQSAGARVVADACRFAHPHLTTQRQETADQLDAKLANARFKELCDMANALGRAPANGFELGDYVANRVEAATEAVASGPNADLHLAEWEAALDGFALGSASTTALQTILSKAGTANSVASSLVGPGSLAGHVLYYWTLAKLPAALAGGPAAREALLAKSTRVLMKLGGIDRSRIDGLAVLVKGRSAQALQTEVRALADQAKNHFMSARGRTSGWGWLTLTLNVISLLQAVEHDDRATAHHVTNIVGGSVGAGAAALQILKEFGATSGRFASTTGAIAKGLGRWAPVASIVSGCMTAYEGLSDGDNALVASGLMSGTGALLASGGSIVVEGLFCIPVWGQALGVVLVLASTQIGNSTPVQTFFAGEGAQLAGNAPLPAIWHGYRTEKDEWKPPMESQWGALAEALDAFKKATEAAHLDTFNDTPANRSFLRSVGFDEEQANAMTGYTPPRDPDEVDITHRGIDVQ